MSQFFANVLLLDTSRHWLYQRWAHALHTVWQNHHSPANADCVVQQLQEIHAYKADATAKLLLVLTLTDSCNGIVELLVDRIPLVEVFNGTVGSFTLTSAEFGVGLDHKEEVFRDFPALISTVAVRFSSPKIMLHF